MSFFCVAWLKVHSKFRNLASEEPGRVGLWGKLTEDVAAKERIRLLEGALAKLGAPG
jgi:hypothetical protein